MKKLRRATISRVILAAAISLCAFAAAAICGEQPDEQASPNSPPTQLILDGSIWGEQRPPRPGEICVVCRRPIGAQDVVYLVKGQRVPLHVPACYATFREAPRSFLAALQPHGAFLGSGGEAQQLSWGWFLAGLYVLLGLVFGALCAHRALRAGRNPTVWFAAGLALNVIGYAGLLTRPRLAIASPVELPEGLGKMPATLAPRPCPKCGRTNHPAASRCADCGAAITAAAASEVDKAGLRHS